tara:strand:+ start:141 stop:752 length:612 start_codon:yes stop_codon:yes gene_type:complete
MNNMEENIIGGVSPMKRRGKSRGKGKRGTGDTRYKRDKWTPPPSGGTATTKGDKKPPAPAKPYTIKDGKVEMNDPASASASASSSSSTPGTDGYWTYKDLTTKTEKERSGYQDSYDAMEDRGGKKFNKRNDKVYDNFEQYETEAIAWNKDNPGYKEYEEKTERVKDKWIPGTAGSASNSESSASSSAGKYRLGGYRAMKKNKK